MEKQARSFAAARILASLSALAVILGLLAQPAQADNERNTARILIVVGPSQHPPGTHEVAAGGRLLAYCLNNADNRSEVEADVVYDWPESSDKLSEYDSFVFLGDNFPLSRWNESAKLVSEFAPLMQAGRGIVCLHYATGLRNSEMGPDGDHPLLHWTGGYFATKCDHHQSIARIYESAEIKPVDPTHPLSRGWSSFEINDEPYINNYFGPNENQLLPGAFAVATSMLPPNKPGREIIAWGIERTDTGRGLGITLPHFYKNWQVEPLRKFILNGIVWTAKREVPLNGVQTSLPDLMTFEPEALEFKRPKRP